MERKSGEQSGHRFKDDILCAFGGRNIHVFLEGMSILTAKRVCPQKNVRSDEALQNTAIESQAKDCD